MLSATRITVVYIVAAALWIALSDRAAAALSPSSDVLALASTIKGWAYVLVTGVILGLILRRYDRQRARQAAELAERERTFRLLADNAQDVVTRYRLSPPCFEYVSPSSEHVLGYPPQAFYDDPGLAEHLIHPDDRPHLDSAAAPGSSLDATIRFRHRDGHWVWMERRSTAVAGPDGEVVAIQTIGRDVSDRQAAEEALRVSEERYRTLADQASDGIFVVDRDGRLADVNATACRLLGYSRDELLARTIDDIVPGSRPWGVSAADALRSIGESLLRERSLRRKDGSLMQAEISIRRLPDDRFHGIVRDITQRKAAEDERDRLAAAVTQATESVLVSDAAGRIVFVNPAFTDLHGFTLEDVAGHTAKSVLQSQVHPPDLHDEVERAIAAGLAWSGRMVNRREDGGTIELDLTISPLRDAAGEIAGWVEVGRDMSRERALETQLRQAQKMEAVGRLAGGVAHDFNNLLAAIRGYAELSLVASASDAELQEFSREILRAADRAKLLTQRLLTFARQQPSANAVVDLNEVVGGLVPMLNQVVDEHTQLVIHAASQPVFVCLDTALIEQAVLNLAINARDAMPSGGRIEIRLGVEDVDESHRAAEGGLKPGRYGLLAVADNGSGIAPEHLRVLFEPFFTTKPANKGTGLGLSIVYSVVTGAGGMVLVDSAPGQGATFELFLPLTEPALGAVVAPPPVSADGLDGGEAILVVDDEPPIRALVNRVLSRRGYVVREAATAEEALLVAALAPQPVLLVTDVLLPQMSGPELADELRARIPGLAVLFMSGYDADRVTRDGQFEPGTAFLPKPFASDDLLRATRRVLDAPLLLDASQPARG